MLAINLRIGLFHCMIRSCWVGGSIHIVQQKLKRKRQNHQKANQKKNIWLATIADRFYFSPLECSLQLKMIDPQLTDYDTPTPGVFAPIKIAHGSW